MEEREQNLQMQKMVEAEYEKQKLVQIAKREEQKLKQKNEQQLFLEKER